jgi:hypothetical protein
LKGANIATVPSSPKLAKTFGENERTFMIQPPEEQLNGICLFVSKQLVGRSRVKIERNWSRAPVGLGSAGESVTAS